MGVILAIVFSKKSDDSDNPTPPFVPSGFNPYYVNMNNVKRDVDKFSGRILFNESYVHAFNNKLFLSDNEDKIGVDAN